MTITATAYTNDDFQMSLDLTNWASIYTLSSCAFKLQIRPSAGSPTLTLGFSSNVADGVAGTATLNANVIVFWAPLSVVKTIPPGVYAFDFGLIPPGGDFIRIDGGTITFESGVTVP